MSKKHFDGKKTLSFLKPVCSYAIRSKTTLDRNFNKYIEILDVKKIRVHDFRHSHVALLIHLKQDILSISKRLGHSDVSITLNNYGYLYDEADKKVASVLDELYI